MSNTPSVYIVDEQSGRSSRLSTVLSFINEPHQQIELANLPAILQQPEPAVVLLGALQRGQQVELLQRFPATAFLLLGEPLRDLLQYATAVGLLCEPFSYAS